MNKILIVDDEKLIRDFLKKFLTSQDYTVDTAKDIDAALLLLKDNDYDCVILDIILPDKNGIFLIEKLRELEYLQPVILITGQPDIDSAKQAIKYNAYDYLTKPISNSELLAVVKNAVKQNQIRLREEELKQQQEKNRELLEAEVDKRVAELHESETKYKNFVEQALAGVYVIQNNVYKYVNKRFLDLVKYSTNDIIDKMTVIDLVRKEDKSLVNENISKIINDELDFAHYSYVMLNSKKTPLDVEVWEGKILYEGQPAIQGILLDVSERRAYNEREKQFELKLMHEHKLAAIGQLATGIAHNLNTPISVILGNAELLQLKEENTPELGKIVRQAERMNSIIQSLLTKSSREQSKKPQNFDLNLMITSELEIFKANLDFKHNVNKNLNFAENIPEFYAVYSEFSQSIMNLIQNAIDAMYKKDKKDLSIETLYDGEYVFIKISDTGCGISEKNYSKLFDPFYTTKPALEDRIKDEPSGTGLGLSSVHNLLSDYGVEINFNSEVNKGTEVVLKIPYSSVSPPSISS
jgi:PAS domain S-box-containing protein